MIVHFQFLIENCVGSFYYAQNNVVKLKIQLIISYFYSIN